MERLQHADFPARLAARIVIPGFPPIACAATEISEQGATLKVASLLGIPESFELVITGKPRRHQCKVTLRAPNKVRVLFQG